MSISKFLYATYTITTSYSLLLLPEVTQWLQRPLVLLLISRIIATTDVIMGPYYTMEQIP